MFGFKKKSPSVDVEFYEQGKLEPFSRTSLPIERLPDTYLKLRQRSTSAVRSGWSRMLGRQLKKSFAKLAAFKFFCTSRASDRCLPAMFCVLTADHYQRRYRRRPRRIAVAGKRVCCPRRRLGASKSLSRANLRTVFQWRWQAFSGSTKLNELTLGLRRCTYALRFLQPLS